MVAFKSILGESAPGKAGDHWRRERPASGRYGGMQIAGVQSSAEAGIRLCGALHRHQVVAEGDDRQQEQDDHGQGKDLRPARDWIRLWAARPEKDQS